MKDNGLIVVLNTSGLLQYKTLTEHTLKYFPYLMEYTTINTEDGMISIGVPDLPDGVKVNDKAYSVHGLSGSGGDPRETSITRLASIISKATKLVLFNVDFVVGVLGAEFTRLGLSDAYQRLLEIEKVDVMCLYQTDEVKYPKLTDLYKQITGKEPPTDLRSTLPRAYMIEELYERGHSIRSSNEAATRALPQEAGQIICGATEGSTTTET